MTIRNWIQEQEKSGKFTFSLQEVMNAFPSIPKRQISNTLYRYSQQKVIFTVYRGFYVIIPVQYALRSQVPPIFYIDSLMEYLQKPYYICLLSAAELHGAAHQRPQRFAVTTVRPVINMSEKRNNTIVWNYKRVILKSLLLQKNSETGIVQYSNAELTAIDLIQYENLVGGLSVAATVLSELAEQLDFSRNTDDLFAVTQKCFIQRLGYILEEVLGERQKADVLYELMQQYYYKANNYYYTPLSAQQEIEGCAENHKWKIIINKTIEIDEL